MKLLNAKYDHDLNVTGEMINLTGTVAGALHVGKDGYVQLHGTVTGDVTLSDLGIVKLHGTVGGNVHNNDGMLEVFGTVKGSVFHQRGRVIYFQGAVVNGERVPADREIGAAIVDR